MIRHTIIHYKITEKNGIVLIFDEVITGFRLALGGAQEYYGEKPDLVTLGKIIGGGFPIGAYGGKREIMSKISPSRTSRISSSGFTVSAILQIFSATILNAVGLIVSPELPSVI